MDENKRIVEINGVKMEVDLRTCKIVDHYKVGDSVKLLLKRYGNSYDTYPAVIIGFTEFQMKPTIELLYLNGRDICFFSYYAPDEGESPEAEIAPFNKYECLFQKDEIVRKLNNDILAKEEELRVLHSKKKAFVEVYAKAFEASTI